MKYNHQKIEKKWQKVWLRNNYRIWHASDKPKKNHIYILDMFPYPSGEGLHVGHIEGYTASDILSRYWRMKGYEVLHPMGWDAFGLPAENYALKTKKPPQEIVPKNVRSFRQQLEKLGFSYDWQREINTTDSNYYKWTQWIFLQLYKKGLAYEDDIFVNWCLSCKTVLADEEAIEGKCERCGAEVERKKLKQWVLKITAYADRLLNDLNLLDWPERVKTMQKNWIGRSEGVEIEFKILERDKYLKVFTTRPDTIFGATFMALAPEHPLALEISAPSYKSDVSNYLELSLRKSDFERQKEINEKTGVFTGAYAVNPANKERIPIWVSDYILMTYGTGAIMGVPAHDERDFDFARQFYLRIKEVISPNGEIHLEMEKPYLGEGILVNSGPFDGISSEKVREKIALYIGGRKMTRYKLRDWIFSRQRYWGEPIPIVKCEKCGNVPLKENQLPLRLPAIKKYAPTGKSESPLADISSWLKTKCPKCKGPAKRETNTMPQWAGSSWYYLAYLLGNKKLRIKNKNLGNPQFKKIFDKWLPVDIYIGGVEHAVLHLLYARFWHKFLFDLGAVSFKEPFIKLVNQGIILGEDGEKMSKSRGNVVNPDEIIEKFGADSLRMHEMFLGPLSFSKPWNSKGIVGIYRFLNRVWNLFSEIKSPAKKEELTFRFSKEAEKKLKENLKELEKKRHKTIKKVTEDIENLRFNTAISALMEYANSLEEIPKNKISKKHFETLTILLSPFAPHLAEELWHEFLSRRSLVSQRKWLSYNKKLIEEKIFTLIAQINGKTRLTMKAKIGISKEEAQNLVLPDLKKYLGDKKPKKVIFVEDKLINFVA